MSTGRLTNAARDEAIESAVEAKLSKRRKALDDARAKLADALYAYTFNEWLVGILAVPEFWFDTTEEVKISCPGFREYWKGGPGPDSRLKMSVPRRWPQAGYSTIEIKDDHPLFAEAQAIVKEHNKLEDAEDKLRTKLRSLLYSVKTFKQLEAEWPEGKAFWPKDAAPVYGVIPATLTMELNEMLGIGEN